MTDTVALQTCEFQSYEDDTFFKNTIKFGNRVVYHTGHTISLIVDAAAKMKDNTGATFRSFRFTRYALLPLEGKDPSISNLRSQLIIADKVINCFLFIGDIDYFVNRRFIKEGEPINVFVLIGTSFITAVDFGSLLSWLNDLKIIDLGRVSMAMGKVPVFRTMALVNLSTYLGVGSLIAVGFFLADAVNRFDNACNKDQRIKAMIDIAGRIVGISLIIFTLSGGTAVPALVILGTMSAALGIAGFLYGEYHKAELADKERKPGYEIRLSQRIAQSVAKIFTPRTSCASEIQNDGYEDPRLTFESGLTPAFA